MGNRGPFDQVSPNLLRNRAVRDFLGQYTERDLPEVVKLTLLYGIINLRKAYPGRLLSVDELRGILSSGQVCARAAFMHACHTVRMWYPERS